MHNEYNLPPPLVGKLTQRDSAQNSSREAEEHDQACGLCKLLLYQVVLTEFLGDALPQGGNIWVPRRVELDTVHGLDGAHGGHLLDEILSFVDEDDEASQKGNISVAGTGRGKGWPALPSGFASMV